MEPRLAAKQYRRPSRRSQTQDLPEGNEEIESVNLNIQSPNHHFP
jgi:hypothetical protein